MSIFETYERLLIKRLGIVNLRHRSAVLSAPAAEGPSIVRELFSALDHMWQKAIESDDFRTSNENFRWHKPQLKLSKKNSSPEVTLERQLINACIEARRVDWSNQVPVASGIAGPRAFKHRAIDLVHRWAPDGFEFVELKVGSNTPLYAATQIMLYGFLWLLARRDQRRLKHAGSPILSASRLKLSVLAPLEFYARKETTLLQRFFLQGLEAVGADQGVDLDFRFTAFEPAFKWPTQLSPEDLVRLLDQRQIVE